MQFVFLMAYADLSLGLNGEEGHMVYRSIPSPLRWAISGVADMWSAVRERRMLAELDDRMLKDIGISRAQAQFVASHRDFRNHSRG
jgi:uncharacterized protein YjiS (DUF1127 family)